MKYVWKKHTIGKRILALFLLVTMFFDTVTASAVEYNGEENIQTELVEVIDGSTETNSEFTTESVQSEVYDEVVIETETVIEDVITEIETAIEEVTTEEVATETVTEELVTETEENTEEVTEEPVTEVEEVTEIIEELEQIVTTEATIFDGLNVTFSGYTATVDGVINNTLDTDVTLYFNVYNTEGVAYTKRYIAWVGAGSSYEVWPEEIRLDQNTAYVELKVFDNYSENNTYTKTYDFKFMPIVVGAFENISIIPSGYGAEIKGSFTPATTKYGTIYLVSYDKDDNRLLSTHVTSFYDGEEVAFTYHDGDIANNASYVKLEAKISDSSLGAEPVYSDKIAYLATRPAVNFSLKGLQTGAAMLKMAVAYDGELALTEESGSLYYQVELSYGTSEDETTWTTTTSSLYVYNDEKESTVTFEKLTSDTTYYGKAKIYYKVYDYDTQKNVVFYETSFNIGTFTTKVNNSYKLNEVFPDAVLCRLVRERMYDSSLTDESEVTTAQLEKVTYLSNYRGSTSTSPVRDLTGITLLTNLISISFENNEISNVADIDWSLLPQLESLYVSGNNIKVFPDLTKNLKLKYINFENNMLSEEELEKASSKLPKGVRISDYTYETQRTEDVELELSDNYYLYGDVTNIGALIKGAKIYTAKAYIDDVEVTSELQYSRELLIKKAPITAGEHTLKVALFDGETKVCESKSYQITIIDEPLFSDKEKYYVPEDIEYIYVRAHICEDKTPTSFELVNNAGMVYGRTDYEPSKYGENQDSRLENSFYFGYNLLYSISGSIELDYHTIPVGTYDVKINYSDGTVDTLKGIVQSVEKGTSIITEINSTSSDMEKLDEYIYIRLGGYNLEPSKFDYSLTLDGKEYPLSYVEHKADSTNNFNVKCAKEGWSSFPEDSSHQADINITPKNGYSVLSEVIEAEYYINTEIDFVYYTEYNNALNKLEVGISDEYLNQTAQLSVKMDWNGSPIATAQAVVKEGVTLFELKNVDGTAFVPVNGQSYYAVVVIGTEESENNYFYNYYYNHNSGDSVDVNYWYVSSLVPVGTEKVYAYFYTDIPYENNTVKVTDYSSTMWFEELADNIEASRLWKFESDGYVAIGIEFATSTLTEGTYYIELFKNDEHVSTTNTRFINLDKFILLRNPSISWESETELSVYLNTINTRETDNYTVQLIDPKGKVVDGLTTKITERYSNALYLSVTGLNYADAAKKYYVKVLHNTLGEACKADKTTFYTDEKGIFTEIYLSKWGNGTDGARTTELYLYEAGLDFPVTLQIYRPYSTTLVKEVKIANASELENDVLYKFTKSFCESLPNKDLMYDFVVSDVNGIVATNSKVIFGYEGQEGGNEEETKTWSYTVDKTTLNIDSESLKTATITVKDYVKAPTFKSSDVKVVTVATSADDKGKAVITAVGEGTAIITVTADGTSKEFEVTVVSTVPKVTVQKQLVINTFFGTEAATALEITNSFNTKITKVTVAEAGFTAKEIDGTWYLCWDGVTTITKDTKLTLTYEVEGFTATDDLVIAPQIITVNGKSTQPTTKLSATTLNFTLYPFKEQAVDLSVANNDYRNIVMVNEEDIVLTTAPSGVEEENTHISFVYDETTGKLMVKVTGEAKDGTYKYAITPGVGTDGAKDATTVNLTVTVKATKPVFKFNNATVTLDAAYPGSSEGYIKLLMDEGYTVEEMKVTTPDAMLDDFIRVESLGDGTVIFRVIRIGLATAGTYVVTPVVKAPTGEIIELAQQKVTVKVTNSSAVSLTSKSKSITVNPNLGNTKIDANVKTKGFTQQNGVYYSTSYEVIPTSLSAKETGMYLSVASTGAISVSNMGACEDGKYTYNVVAAINGSDGTVTYSKPLPLTVQLKTKALTIVPEKSAITVYKEYCTTVTKENQTYYQVMTPVKVKESAKMWFYTEFTNAMADKGVSTYLADSGNVLVLEFPTTMSALKNLTITPEDERFASFKVSVTVKNSEPKAAFEKTNVTMNRYKDAYIDNSVLDTEGYTISYIKDVVIKKGSTVMGNEWFMVDTWDSTISMGIAAEYDDKVANASYKVSATPVVIIDGEEKDLAPCSFTLKVTQPTVKLEVGSYGEKSKKVYLHPSIGVVSSYDFINAFSDNYWLEIAELSVSTKDKTLYTSAETEYAKWVDISALQEEDGTYKNGKNNYNVTVKVKKANGVVDTKEYTLKNAFVATVCDLPKSIQLEKSKLTFSPNIASSIATNVKSAELKELVNSGEFYYDISVVETNKKYVELEEDLKNDVLSVYGTNGGSIVVNPGSSVATKNATYYYLVTVNLNKYDENYETGETVETYTAKLSVAVKNTLPKAKLQMSSISLDNAFVNQGVTNSVILTTGTAFWSLADLNADNIVIKSGNKDVTEAGYFNVICEGSNLRVFLNNEKDGQLMTVPKGTYKLIVTPTISGKDDSRETTIASLTVTVKVTSSRPTVKVTSKVTVKVGGDDVILKPTLKNNGKITALQITKITKPSKATEQDVNGIILDILEDGSISVHANENVMAGTYKYTINPVTKIDDMDIVLDKVTVSVVVKK